MTGSTIGTGQTVAPGGEGTLLANRYRILRQLGQGGMGSVWLAEDTQLDDKPFAIKMLPAILVSNKRAYRQLKDEALVAMRLVHPNIVQIRAFEENGGNPFLVMDYVDGQTLDDYLAEHFPADVTPADVARPPRPCCKGEGALATSPGTTGVPPVAHCLPEADVLRILRPIAAALDYAHGEGVVHRDVKPANVMIRKDGHPFILDFGIAREIQETLTRVTGKLSSGTLLYMSPEQLNGAQPKPAQDVYSFAAMVYECLKGEPPFVRGQIEHQIMNKAPEPLPGGTQLVASVMSGLAKKPEDRPPTCSAVLEGNDLSRVERVEKVWARVPCDRPDIAMASVSHPQQTAGEPSVLSKFQRLAVPTEDLRYLPPEMRERLKHGVSAAPSPVMAATRSATGPSDVPQSRERSSSRCQESKAHKGGCVWKIAVFMFVLGLMAVGSVWYLRQRQMQTGEQTHVPPGIGEQPVEKGTGDQSGEKETGPTLKEAAREEAARIRKEAEVWRATIALLSDEDAFWAKKVDLANEFERADALFGDKMQRWSEAAVSFTNYVSSCKDLLALDVARRMAKEARAKTEEAKDKAEKAESETYARTRWSEAVRLLDSANADFARMQFADAERSFASAEMLFNQCVADVDAVHFAAEREEAAEVRKEAEEWRARVTLLSDEDGFGAKKDGLSRTFKRADALFLDDKMKRWGEAAVSFTNYVCSCKDLLALDVARRMAKEARAKTEEAKDKAENAEAETYARTRWNDAVRLLDDANTEFAQMQFAAAAFTFASAEKSFNQCVSDAETEHEKPRVYLTATLNGVPKAALVTEGMQENGKHTTPLTVNVMLPIGSSGKFAVEYSENGVKYVGKRGYIARKGLLNVEIPLEEERFSRPATINFCRHCGFSLKDYATVGLKCPRCGKNLLGN